MDIVKELLGRGASVDLASQVRFLTAACTDARGGGGHLHFRLDIILVKRFSNHTLNTYFSGMKIDPKYTFLPAFFLICVSCPFQNLSIWPKTYPFFPILAVFAPLNDVRAYIAWSWKHPNYMNFVTRMISNFKYKWTPGYRWDYLSSQCMH